MAGRIVELGAKNVALKQLIQDWGAWAKDTMEPTPYHDEAKYEELVQHTKDALKEE